MATKLVVDCSTGITSEVELTAEEVAQREADALAWAEAEAARRELAMLKAGIDLDTPQGKLFAKAYDGESTLDAVKKAAEEYGVIQAMNAIPAEELDAIDRVSRAGAVPSSTPMDDPLAALNNAETPDEIIQLLKKSGITIDNEQPGQWKALV